MITILLVYQSATWPINLLTYELRCMYAIMTIANDAVSGTLGLVEFASVWPMVLKNVGFRWRETRLNYCVKHRPI